MNDFESIKEALKKKRDALENRVYKDVPSIPVNTNLVNDKKTENEAKALATDSLAEVANAKEHDRNERLRDSVALGIRWIFWIFLFCITVMGLIWFYHQVCPLKWHFLDLQQIDKIGTLLIGGASSSFVSGYAKKRLG